MACSCSKACSRSITLHVIVDNSTFGVDEVSDSISTVGGLYSNAFWLVLEDFLLSQLGRSASASRRPSSSRPLR
jgi:hypothetical protein